MLDQGHVRRRSPTFRSGLMLIYREDALYSCGLEYEGWVQAGVIALKALETVKKCP